jgi:hypothetical protein
MTKIQISFSCYEHIYFGVKKIKYIQMHLFNRGIMRNKGTQTIQPRFCDISEAEKNNINKGETEDNMGLMLQVLDSLNALCELLSRVDYALKRKNMEHILYRKDEGAKK